MNQKLTQETIERLLLQKTFTDESYRTIIFNNFDDRFFENKDICLILNITMEYFNQYSKLPSGSILKLIFEKEENEKSLKTELKKAIDLETDEDPDFIRDTIVSFIQQKAMYFAIVDNIEDITEHNDINNVIKQFQEISQINLINDLGLNFFEEHEKHMEDVCNPEMTLPTMYEDLDNLLNGGVLQDGKALYVIMAQAGLGKSLFMSNLAVNFLTQGKTVAVISLEMSEMIYGKRIDAHISKVDVNKLAENSGEVIDKVKDFKELYDSTLFIKEFPPNTINTNTISSYLHKLKLKIERDVDVIIVDYINLLKPNAKVDGGTYEKIGEVSTDLRALSYAIGAPCITCIQSNRSGYDTSEISMENISESICVAYTADFIGALFQLEGDREAGKLSMLILKNRNGIMGRVIPFDVNYRTLRISSAEVEQTEEGEDLTQDVFSDITM